jgi:hypothetical protein
VHCIGEEQEELLQMVQKRKEKTKAREQAASNQCKCDAADLCFTVLANTVVGYLVFLRSDVSQGDEDDDDGVATVLCLHLPHFSVLCGGTFYCCCTEAS